LFVVISPIVNDFNDNLKNSIVITNNNDTSCRYYLVNNNGVLKKNNQFIDRKSYINYSCSWILINNNEFIPLLLFKGWLLRWASSLLNFTIVVMYYCSNAIYQLFPLTIWRNNTSHIISIHLGILSQLDGYKIIKRMINLKHTKHNLINLSEFNVIMYVTI